MGILIGNVAKDAEWHHSFAETFDEAARPSYAALTGIPGTPDQGYLVKPWNYDEEYNSGRLYPLVMYCAGTGEVGADIDTLFAQIPDVFQQGASGNYKVGSIGTFEPCFVYVLRPSELYLEDMAADDAIRLTWLKANYRIDPERLYFFGFSMGGQAAHWLTDAIFPTEGHQIAAINRNSGGYKPDILDHDLFEWLHVGLSDSQYRIDNIRLIYSNFKTNNPGGTEYVNSETIGGYPVTHYSYFVNGVHRCTLSEYTNMGHNNPDSIYTNSIFEWIFSKRRTY